MRKSLILLIFFPFLMATQCHKEKNCHKTVEFYNNDTIDVYVLPYFGNDSSYISSATPGARVNSNGKNDEIFKLRDCLEYRIPSESPPYLKAVVTEAKLVDDSTWDYVSYHKLFLKQYSLSLEDLQNMNWTIVYP